MKQENRKKFIEGIKDGTPIGLAYFAVSFSLGIIAKKAGLSPIDGFIASMLNMASAGEYVGFTLMAAGASYIEMAGMILITNARYLLMSCSLSQKLRPNEKLIHRLGVGYLVTDEIFGIAVNQEGDLNPFYSYGAGAVAIPLWSLGTALGILAGNILPVRLVSALSVALYGMFLGIIVPPAKKNKVILGIIIISFILSYLSSSLAVFSSISEGTRIIILTVVISLAAAVLFPVKEEEDA